MPGRRLGHEDRHRIARWLLEGRTYTEIARRLNRSTSTITREVARNGGPRHYQADHAHRLTRLRARRPKPTPQAAVPADSAAYGRDPRAVFAFEERLAEVATDTGSPHTVSRILAALFITDSGSLTTAELVQRLRISPASISTAVKLAENQGLLGRVHGPRGKQTYTIEGDIGRRPLMANVRSNELLAEICHQGAEVLGRSTPAGARLDKMGTFLSLISQDLAISLERRADEVFGDHPESIP